MAEEELLAVVAKGMIMTPSESPAIANQVINLPAVIHKKLCMYLYIKLHIHKQYLKLTPLSFHKDTEDVFLETVNFYKSIY